MNALALLIAVVSFVLAAIAYWRAGGKQDVENAKRELEREIEALRAKQKDLTENVLQRIAQAYERSRQRLQRAREGLAQAKEEAVEGLEKQVHLAQEQLEGLAKRLEEAAKSTRDATLTTARNLEEAIATRVHRIEARAMLLRAKAKATRATNLATKNEFQRAEQQLEQATELLASARTALGKDHAYDQLLDSAKLGLSEATDAVRTHAEDLRKKLERVLSDADQLVESLASDEKNAIAKERLI